MTAPKRRLSKARRDSRRAHDSLAKPAASTCSNCGEIKKPHVLCPHCGYYNGVQYKEGAEE